VRALGRFHWLLPAVTVPACIVAVAAAIQAAAFGRAPGSSLVTVGALRELVRYHVMRGTESLDGRYVSTTCIQGWFRAPRHRRLVRGALVLLGDGERLYVLGSGVKRQLAAGQSRPADLADRVRFVLAACPRYLDDRFATDLLVGRQAKTVDGTADGERAIAITFGAGDARLTYAVARRSDKPLALTYDDGHIHGSSDLAPGGGAAAMSRVRRSFHLPAARAYGRA
jgi:hypothetical protein